MFIPDIVQLFSLLTLQLTPHLSAFLFELLFQLNSVTIEQMWLKMEQVIDCRVGGSITSKFPLERQWTGQSLALCVIK